MCVTAICGCCEKTVCGCCCRAKAEEPATTFNKSNRSCTDILFLLLFILSWVGVIVIISTAGSAGAAPYRVIRGVDWKGRVCGRDSGVTDKPLAMWPDIRNYDVKFCVSSCNQTQLSSMTLLPYNSKPIYHYCIPSVDNLVNGTINVQVQVTGDFQTASELASRAVADLLTTWPVILAAAGIALIVSWLYSICSRWFTGFLVWFAVLVMILGGVLVSWALLKSGAEAADSGLPDRAKGMRGLGWAAVACTVIFTLIIISLRQQIRIAIEIFKEAGRALEDMPTLVCFPVWPMLFAGGYLVFWIATSLFIFSVKTKTDLPIPSPLSSLNEFAGAVNYTRYQFDQSFKSSWAYVFFHLLWVIQFLVYFTYMVVAGAIANWYFTRRDGAGAKIRGDSDNELAHSPIWSSFLRTLRYHLGTIALGSLIIAIIQFIRACVKYAEYQMNKVDKESKIRKVLFCMLHCFLYCLECCMDKINKNAFVWTAIWGSSFGPAVCSSFSLLWNNLLRVAAINMVGTYLLFVGKVVVALLTVGICGVIIKGSYDDETLNSPVVPLVVIFLFAYMVASLFMVIFGTTIDTVFICFLVDEKVNKGTGQMYASEGLQRVIDAYGEMNQKKAEEVKKIADERAEALQKPKE